jgi:hypothetical protein
VQDRSNADLHEKMKGTVWMTGCKSWYLNANGTNSTIWPDFTVTYWWRTRGANRRDFEIAPAPKPVSMPERVAA